MPFNRRSSFSMTTWGRFVRDQRTPRARPFILVRVLRICSLSLVRIFDGRLRIARIEVYGAFLWGEICSALHPLPLFFRALAFAASVIPSFCASAYCLLKLEARMTLRLWALSAHWTSWPSLFSIGVECDVVGVIAEPLLRIIEKTYLMHGTHVPLDSSYPLECGH